MQCFSRIRTKLNQGQLNAASIQRMSYFGHRSIYAYIHTSITRNGLIAIGLLLQYPNDIGNACLMLTSNTCNQLGNVKYLTIQTDNLHMMQCDAIQRNIAPSISRYICGNTALLSFTHFTFLRKHKNRINEK